MGIMNDIEWTVNFLMLILHGMRGHSVPRPPSVVLRSMVSGMVSCDQTWPNDDNLLGVEVSIAYESV